MSTFWALWFKCFFFPAIVFWVEARNPKMKQNKKSYIELYNTTVKPSAAAEADALTSDVCSDIEKSQETSIDTRKMGCVGWRSLSNACQVAWIETRKS